MRQSRIHRVLRSWLILANVVGVMAPTPALARDAAIAIVVNRENRDELSRQWVTDLFLGRRTKFPDGSSAKPVDQAKGTAIFLAFYSELADLDESELNAHWSTLIFTGTAVPPRRVAGDEDVKNLVRAQRGGIGYIDVDSVDASVRVVDTLRLK